ncbi:MAG TPA: DUF1488 family protein [Xanthobacteraceae bacterium]|nr:DUF1488 family protein [Xanthobacteraceae bacterium]
MLLNIIPGLIDVQANGIAFQANYYGDKNVSCRISRDALLDLAGYHQLGGRDDELFQALRQEIERLSSAKYRARRMETNGELLVSSADILLYGFRARRDAEEPLPPAAAQASAARVGRG